MTKICFKIVSKFSFPDNRAHFETVNFRQEYEEVFATYREAMSKCGDFNKILPIESSKNQPKLTRESKTKVEVQKSGNDGSRRSKVDKPKCGSDNSKSKADSASRTTKPSEMGGADPEIFNSASGSESSKPSTSESAAGRGESKSRTEHDKETSSEKKIESSKIISDRKRKRQDEDRLVVHDHPAKKLLKDVEKSAVGEKAAKQDANNSTAVSGFNEVKIPNSIKGPNDVKCTNHVKGPQYVNGPHDVKGPYDVKAHIDIKVPNDVNGLKDVKGHNDLKGLNDVKGLGGVTSKSVNCSKVIETNKSEKKISEIVSDVKTSRLSNSVSSKSVSVAGVNDVKNIIKNDASKSSKCDVSETKCTTTSEICRPKNDAFKSERKVVSSSKTGRQDEPRDDKNAKHSSLRIDVASNGRDGSRSRSPLDSQSVNHGKMKPLEIPDSPAKSTRSHSRLGQTEETSSKNSKAAVKNVFGNDQKVENVSKITSASETLNDLQPAGEHNSETKKESNGRSSKKPSLKSEIVPKSSEPTLSKAAAKSVDEVVKTMPDEESLVQAQSEATKIREPSATSSGGQSTRDWTSRSSRDRDRRRSRSRDFGGQSTRDRVSRSSRDRALEDMARGKRRERDKHCSDKSSRRERDRRRSEEDRKRDYKDRRADDRRDKERKRENEGTSRSRRHNKSRDREVGKEKAFEAQRRDKERKERDLGQKLSSLDEHLRGGEERKLVKEKDESLKNLSINISSKILPKVECSVNRPEALRNGESEEEEGEITDSDDEKDLLKGEQVQPVGSQRCNQPVPERQRLREHPTEKSVKTSLREQNLVNPAAVIVQCKAGTDQLKPGNTNQEAHKQERRSRSLEDCQNKIKSSKHRSESHRRIDEPDPNKDEPESLKESISGQVQTSFETNDSNSIEVPNSTEQRLCTSSSYETAEEDCEKSQRQSRHTMSDSSKNFKSLISPSKELPADLTDVDTADLESMIQAKLDLMKQLEQKQNKYLEKIQKSRRNSENEHPTIIPVLGEQSLKIRITLPSRRTSDENEQPNSHFKPIQPADEQQQDSEDTDVAQSHFDADRESVEKEIKDVSEKSPSYPVMHSTVSTVNLKRLTPVLEAGIENSPTEFRSRSQSVSNMSSPDMLPALNWKLGPNQVIQPNFQTPRHEPAGLKLISPAQSSHSSPKNLCSPWGEGIQDLFSDSWNPSPSPISLQPTKNVDFSSTAGDKD